MARRMMIAVVIVVLGVLCFSIADASVTVSGYAFLEDEENHRDIKVLFEAASGSAVTDTTYTDSTGYFQIALEIGMYTITYSKEDHPSKALPTRMISEDTVLGDRTLYPAGTRFISGGLEGTLARGFYIVTGDISVRGTLIIEPGVTIRFDGPYGIYGGSLRAVGTETDSILFTSNRPGLSPGDWTGIKFDGGTASSLVYCRIENAQRGIHCYQSSPTIVNNTITGNSVEGIYCYLSSPTIAYNTIMMNGRHGIFCNDSSPTITNNTITGNRYRGIYCYDGSSPTITNNIIVENDEGIYCWRNSFPSITYNDVWGNPSGDFVDCPDYVGDLLTVNANGDSCDVYCNIILNTLFRDPQNGDVRLQWGSPGIDAGDPTFSFDPDGTVADMGAFYFDQRHVDIIPPSVPQNLSAAAGDTTVTLTFSANPDTEGVAFYVVYRDTRSFTPISIRDSLATTPDTTYMDDRVIGGVAYHYRVSAVDTAGNESGYSDEVSATPTGVTLLDISGKALISLSKNAGIGASETVEAILSMEDVVDIINFLIRIEFDAVVLSSGNITLNTEVFPTGFPGWAAFASVSENTLEIAAAALGLSAVSIDTATWILKVPFTTSASFSPAQKTTIAVVEAQSTHEDKTTTMLDVTEAQVTLNGVPLLPGDMDGDGTVGIPDFFIFAAAFGCSREEACYNPFADIDGDGTVGISDFFIFAANFGEKRAKLAALAREVLGIPLSPMLYQNAPNPFNPVTTIVYDLPEASDVGLTIYTVTGQKATTLVSGHQEAGHYEVAWDGSGFGNSVYFYRLEAGEFVETRRMVLIK